MNIAYLQNPVDVYCKVTAALPSTAVQAATVTCDTVAAPFSDGTFVINPSTPPLTAVCTCGLALPTAWFTSALMTIMRFALRLPPNHDTLLPRLASSPLPKNASRSGVLASSSPQYALASCENAVCCEEPKAAIRGP